MGNIIKLYGGDILLKFTHNGHRYQISLDSGKSWNKKLGVTSVISGVITKDGLLPWAAKLATQTFLEAVEAYEAENGTLDGIDLDDIAAVAKTAHITKRDAGADRGTALHDWLTAWTADHATPVPQGLEKQARAFIDWARDNEVKFLASERVVYSKTLDYAGTLDALAVIGDKTVLMDYKSGNCRQEFKNGQYTGNKGAYPEHFIQVGAYSLALREETKQFIDAHAVVYIQPDGRVEYFENDQVEANEDSFALTLGLYRQLQRLKR